MNENKTKRKDIVKNVAIVFLAVLLALTFFSNTIMNWSLPEVSGQYAGYGTITNSIRASGTVNANMGYSVTIGETREIKSVLIRKGDKVEAGQLIFTLEEGDSSELEAAREQLDTLEYNYKLAVIQSGSSGYNDLEIELGDLKAELAEAQEKLDSLEEYGDLAEIEAELKEAQKELEGCTEKVDELEKAYADFGTEGDAGYPEVRTALAARNAAKEADAAAQKRYEELTVFQSDLESAQSAVSNAEKRLSELITAQSQAEKDYEYKHPMLEAYRNTSVRLQNARSMLDTWFATPEQQEADPEGYAAALQELEDAQTAMSVLVPVTNEDLEELNEKLLVFKDDIYYATRELEEARALLEICNPDNLELTDVRLDVARAKQHQRETAAILAEAEKALEQAASGKKDDVLLEVKAAKEELEAAKEKVKGLQEEKDRTEAAIEAHKNAAAQVEDLNKRIKAKEREIENAQKQGSAEQQRMYLELQQKKKEIDKQKELVEKLESRRMGTDVTAKYAGEVTSVNVMVGDKVTPDTTLAQIGVEGKGYTMLVTVTNEQSRRLNVGDQAKVNNYWWGDIRLTLAAIRTDRSNPGQNKVLEFDVEGDVVDGQSLDITIGERSNSYNLVVPNSAVREDSNGNFILVAEAKSTPLGNRYTAVRIDVTVLEKDNYNTAIDAGTDFGYQYVITAATKPLEAGMLVRLAES